MTWQKLSNQKKPSTRCHCHIYSPTCTSACIVYLPPVVLNKLSMFLTEVNPYTFVLDPIPFPHLLKDHSSNTLSLCSIINFYFSTHHYQHTNTPLYIPTHTHKQPLPPLLSCTAKICNTCILATSSSSEWRLVSTIPLKLFFSNSFTSLSLNPRVNSQLSSYMTYQQYFYI